MPPSLPQPTRRQLLTAAGTVTFTGSLSGCTLLGEPQAILEVTFEPRKFIVKLVPDAGVTQLVLIGPKGKPQMGYDFPAGTTTVPFKLTGDETSGEYKIVANKGTETIDKQTVTLTKTMALPKVQVINGGAHDGWGLVLFIKATGNLPINLRELHKDDLFKIKGSITWDYKQFQSYSIYPPDGVSYGKIIPAGTTQRYIVDEILVHSSDSESSASQPQSVCSGMNHTITVRFGLGDKVIYIYDITIKEKGEPDSSNKYLAEGQYVCSKTTVTDVAQIQPPPQ